MLLCKRFIIGPQYRSNFYKMDFTYAPLVRMLAMVDISVLSNLRTRTSFLGPATTIIRYAIDKGLWMVNLLDVGKHGDETWVNDLGGWLVVTVRGLI